MALTFKNQTAATRKIYMKRWAHVRLNRNLDWIDSVSAGAGATPTREIPAGAKDGSNLDFTLSVAGTLVEIFLRGSKLKSGVGYTLLGTALTMAAGYAPEATDPFEALIWV